MPIFGAPWRGEQLSLLAKQLHSRQSSECFQQLLEDAKGELQDICQKEGLDQEDIFERTRNLNLLEQDFRRQKSLDPNLVSRIALAKAEGYNLWQLAKSKNDFQLFSPALCNLISLRQEQASQLPESGSCWETLAQPFEPDITISRLEELFAPLRKALPELLDEVRTSQKISTLNWDLDEPSQKFLCDELLKQWGRDEKITTVARSPHPFSITLGPQDFRLTTRFVPGQPFSALLATAHEWGHSLYEQGLPSQTHQWFAWPLGQATSMGVHESQSLFWENRIARSKAFSDRFWPYFAKAGAPVESGIDLWRAMNPLMPGLNRVEADELTYGMHILVRTDLEIALLEKGLEVNALPEEWNKSYRNLLGVAPRNDVEGCLQDVHWSEGQFGYFPSYLLGHLISAQISEAMNSSLKNSCFQEDDAISAAISSGQESIMLAWLRKEVHHYGRKVNGEELVEKVTGVPLSSSAFLDYLREKVGILIDAS